MTRILFLLLFGLFLLGLDAPDEAQQVPSGPAEDEAGPVGIVGGEETADYEAVVALTERDDEGYTWFYCTGTLIEPDLVLTAAHCFDGPTPTEVFIGTDLFAWEGDFEPIESYDVHPLWDGLEDYGAIEHDVAVIRLEGAVSGVDPIPLHTGPASALQGETIRYVGFGDSAGASPSPIKRTALSVVDDADYFDFFITSAVTGSPCSGDSGGPMLVEDVDSVTVAGVDSFVIEACGDRAGATRVEEYLDWIADPDGWEPGDDDDDASDDDDDDREVVNMGDLNEGSGCGASLAAGAAGPLGLLLLVVGRVRKGAGPSPRATPAR